MVFASSSSSTEKRRNVTYTHIITEGLAPAGALPSLGQASSSISHGSFKVSIPQPEFPAVFPTFPAVFVGSLGSGQLVLLSRLLCWCLALGSISSALAQQQLLCSLGVCRWTKLLLQSGLGLLVENGTFSASLASAVGWGGLKGWGWQAFFGYEAG